MEEIVGKEFIQEIGVKKAAVKESIEAIDIKDIMAEGAGVKGRASQEEEDEGPCGGCLRQAASKEVI